MLPHSGSGFEDVLHGMGVGLQFLLSETAKAGARMHGEKAQHPAPVAGVLLAFI